MKIKDYEIGKSYNDVFMIVDITERKTKTGKSYLVLDICDGEQNVQAKLWNESLSTFNYNKSSLIDLLISVSEYNNAKSYTITEYKPLTGNENVSIKDFIKSAPYSGEELFDALISLTKSFTNRDLANLVTNIYMDNKEKLLYWAAAKSVHHNCYTGLLWHIYRMTMSAQRVSKVYQKTLDTELLLTGIMLHDIGKLEELTTDEFGNASYSIKGNLLGHAVLGILIIEKYCTKLGINDELKLLLQHILAAHHKLIEWGAIKTSAIPEAALVSYVDQIDADMYKYEENLALLNEGSMSDRIFSMGNVVYRPNSYVVDK